MGPWSSKPSSPPTVATDKVVPLHFWDDNQMLRPIIPEVTLRFNDALDVAKIRFALDRLLNREGWRKLGARTRMNVCTTHYSEELYNDNTCRRTGSWNTTSHIRTPRSALALFLPRRDTMSASKSIHLARNYHDPLLTASKLLYLSATPWSSSQ